jgi:hypothetical protein
VASAFAAGLTRLAPATARSARFAAFATGGSASGFAASTAVGFAATFPEAQATTSSPAQSAMGQSATGENAQNAPQESQQMLTAQGFTDVKVVRDSFLVSAKDKQGYPVTMLIGPNSLTAFTMVENTKQDSGGNQPRQ